MATAPLTSSSRPRLLKSGHFATDGTAKGLADLDLKPTAFQATYTRVTHFDGSGLRVSSYAVYGFGKEHSGSLTSIRLLLFPLPRHSRFCKDTSYLNVLRRNP